MSINSERNRQSTHSWQKVGELATALFRINLTKEISDLVNTIRFSAFKVGLGFTSGTILIILRHHWDPMMGNKVFGVIGEHLGMGLIVASVAVFGYEWRSQSKEAMELSKRLVVSIDEVRKAKKEIALVDGLLRIVGDKGLAQLDTVLVSILGEESRNFIEDLKSLVDSVFTIQSRETWMKYAYVDFIKKLFNEYIVSNAKELRHVNDGGKGHFILPSTAGLTADSLLAAHIRKAIAGDSYDVISDIGSWRDSKLKVFEKDSDDAVARGVTIRRTFNFFLHGHPDSRDHSFKDICDRTIRTLIVHKDKAFKSNGKYQVRFFWTEERKEFQALTDSSLSVDAQHWHFGLFKRNAAPQVVTRFKVERTNLSDMEVNSNESDIRGDAELFETYWDASTPLDDDLIRNIDLYLKRTIPTYALTEKTDHSIR